MKIILLIIGLAAAAFGGMHLLVLPGVISRAHGPLASAVIGGHSAGAATGVLIAFLCLRKAFASEKPHNPR